MKLYLFWKFLHIAGVLLWIGPPLGAYWVHLRAFTRNESPQELMVEKRIRRAFTGVLMIEHIGLALLIIGALGMLTMTDWTFLDLFWVQAKIALVALIIIPLEIFDIWMGQYTLGRALSHNPDAEMTLDERSLCRRYDRLVMLSIPILLLVWPVIFYLAIFKPH